MIRRVVVLNRAVLRQRYFASATVDGERERHWVRRLSVAVVNAAFHH